VDACADEGDEVATAICRRAGADLAYAVLAVVRRLAAQETLVSYQGAVLGRSRLVRAAFVETLGADGTGIDVRPPRFEPVAGAVLLGVAAAGWRLALHALESRRGV
jgi:N-acetylglucosamine kinase-like BadF-type ATPase